LRLLARRWEGASFVVAGYYGSTAAVEVYEEALGRWRRLPCRL
jgi:hypothetical protein